MIGYAFLRASCIFTFKPTVLLPQTYLARSAKLPTGLYIIKYSLQTSYIRSEQQKRLIPSIGQQIFLNKHGRMQAGPRGRSSDVILTSLLKSTAVQSWRRPCLLGIVRRRNLPGWRGSCGCCTAYSTEYRECKKAKIFGLDQVSSCIIDAYLLP